MDEALRHAIANGLESSAVGIFFTISGLHKLLNKGRHAALVETLKADKVPLVGINQWWVPTVETIAGSCLSLAIFPKVAAVFLLAICVVACLVDGRKRVEEFKPLNAADRLDDWLYLPEVLYAVLLLSIIIR